MASPRLTYPEASPKGPSWLFTPRPPPYNLFLMSSQPGTRVSWSPDGLGWPRHKP